jgi:hypothetical protein
MKIPHFDGHAVCSEHVDLFDRPGRTDAKRALCLNCTCLFECHTWAVVNEAFGYWATTGPAERARIRDTFGIAPTFGANGASLTRAVAA